MKETKIFYKRVIDIIKKIPKGKVATYRQIAIYAGNPTGARAVGWILHSSSNKNKLPWHRVINSKGSISLTDIGYEIQKRLLKTEGIKFNKENHIDLDVYLWRPKKIYFTKVEL